jgi:hypothetical protein
MRTVCEQGASPAVPRRLTATPAAPRSSNQRVGRHRGGTDNQPRQGHRCLTPEPAPRPELASLERPRNSSGGAGLSRWTRPLHHGQGVDRHHLPRWRPEPPFLPGRIADRRGPERQGRSTHPPTVPSGSRAKRSIRNCWRFSRLGVSGAATGAVRGAARRRPGHHPGGGHQGRALRPRRRHQDLEPHATRAPAPARGLRAAARLPRPPTDLSHRRIGTVTVRCVTRSFEREGTASLSGFCTGACFPRIAPTTWANDGPLETVANRSVPMACGPNVDQARPPAGAAAALHIAELAEAR